MAHPYLPQTSSQHSSHTGPPTVPQLPTPAAVSPIIPPHLLSVYPPSLRTRLHHWFPTLSRDWSPGYVTKTKSATLNRSFLPAHFVFCSRGSLSLAPKQACPPTDCTNNATTASLLVLSEASSSFPTCFTRLTHASTIPALAHPQVDVSTVRSSSVAFLSFHFPRYHWRFHFSVCFLFVYCHPSSSFPDFKLHSSYITLGHLWRHCYLDQQQFHCSLLPCLLSVYPLSLRARFHSWSPDYVTRMMSAARTAPFCFSVSCQDIFCSGVTGPLASSPFASPLDLNHFSIFLKGGPRRKARSIPDSLHP